MLDQVKITNICSQNRGAALLRGEADEHVIDPQTMTTTGEMKKPSKNAGQYSGSDLHVVTWCDNPVLGDLTEDAFEIDTPTRCLRMPRIEPPNAMCDLAQRDGAMQ